MEYSKNLNIKLKNENNCLVMEFTYSGVHFDWVGTIKNNIGRLDRQSGINILNMYYNNSYFDVEQDNEGDNIHLTFTIPDEECSVNTSTNFNRDPNIVDGLHFGANIDKNIGEVIDYDKSEVAYTIILEVTTNIFNYGG